MMIVEGIKDVLGFNFDFSNLQQINAFLRKIREKENQFQIKKDLDLLNSDI